MSRRHRPGPVPAAFARTAVGLGTVTEREARRRVEALAGVAHPGVCVPLRVERDGAEAVVVSPLLTGPTLGEAAGPGIEDLGVWVGVMAELASALAALHSAGLAHGDLSPANVVMAGRPVLVDVVGGALGKERGTPGFASPERGARASAADDVHALGMVGRAIAGAGIRDVALAWTAPLVHVDPGLRPSAAAVARGVRRCAPSARWEPQAGAPPALARAPRTVRIPGTLGWRVRRTAPRLLGATAALAIAVAAAWTAAPLLTASAGAPAPGPTPSATADVGAGVREDPADAARALTVAYAESVAAGDRAALTALVVPGSPAWAAASHQATLVEQGGAVRGAAVEVSSAVVREQGTDHALVEVQSVLSSHAALTPDGAWIEVPARRETVLLTLRWGREGWRVERAEPVVSAAP